LAILSRIEPTLLNSNFLISFFCSFAILERFFLLLYSIYKNVFELPFDFYIPSARTCIEFDGKQHFYPIEHFGGLKTYERLKINDKIKNDYCEDNYINLIRIRYDQMDNIEKLLSDNLKIYLKHKDENYLIPTPPKF